jgi:hypothetical protein
MAVDKKTSTLINRSAYVTYPTTGLGTITTGTTLNCNFGTLGSMVSGYVYNDDSSNDLLVRLNFTTNNYIVVPAGTSLQFDKEYITRIYLTNSSGSSIQYQVVMFGG